MEKNESLQSRKDFINISLQLTGAAILLSNPVISRAGEFFTTGKNYTVQDVIDIILKETSQQNSTDTVDTIKAGSGTSVVTGIVTTMFATVEVIKKAIQLKSNFIIAHEPTFYNHADDKNWIQNNEVQQKKLQLLNDNNITVWRAHDCWHAMKPDGVIYGVIKKLNWLPYYQKNERVIDIPATSIKNLISQFKQKLGIKQMRIIGESNHLCKRIAILPGAWGGKEHITAIIDERPDLLVVGELSEWETAEYVRDARSFGANISLVILGHALSEEPGMEWMAEWLQPKLPGIKISHIASKEPFAWV